jgi:hypothetical protein
MSSPASVLRQGIQIPDLELPSINYDSLFRERHTRVFHVSNDEKHYSQRDLIDFRRYKQVQRPIVIN